MQDFLLNHYLWLKALHIIAVISWMAGLLYLPRLFVYHVDAQSGSEKSETFKIMERRLLRFIMRPAMIATWVFGGLMLWVNFDGLMSQGWIHVKLLLVVLMTGLHHAMGAWVRKFAADVNTKSARFYRIMNEVPTVMMIVIVILAVVKPF
jgi:putative membrane protein